MQLLSNTCVASSINTISIERFLLHIQNNVEVLHDEVMYILHFIFPGSSSLRLLTKQVPERKREFWCRCGVIGPIRTRHVGSSVRPEVSDTNPHSPYTIIVHAWVFRGVVFFSIGFGWRVEHKIGKGLSLSSDSSEHSGIWNSRLGSLAKRTWGWSSRLFSDWRDGDFDRCFGGKVVFLSSELQRYRVSISKMDFLLSSHGSRESMDSILNNFFVNGCFSSRSSILSLLSPFIIVQICYILPHFDNTRSSIINSTSVLLIFYSIDFNLLRIFLYL